MTDENTPKEMDVPESLTDALTAIGKRREEEGRIVMNSLIGGALIHGGPVDNRMKYALEKAEKMIEYEFGQTVDRRLFDLNAAIGWAHYLNPESKEWTHIYLGKWMSEYVRAD